MDLAELIYKTLRRHLGTDKEDAALRATAKKIAAFWSKETQPPDSSASVAQADHREQEQGREER